MVPTTSWMCCLLLILFLPISGLFFAALLLLFWCTQTYTIIPLVISWILLQVSIFFGIAIWTFLSSIQSIQQLHFYFIIYCFWVFDPFCQSFGSELLYFFPCIFLFFNGQHSNSLVGVRIGSAGKRKEKVKQNLRKYLIW